MGDGRTNQPTTVSCGKLGIASQFGYFPKLSDTAIAFQDKLVIFQLSHLSPHTGSDAR